MSEFRIRSCAPWRKQAPSGNYVDPSESSPERRITLTKDHFVAVLRLAKSRGIDNMEALETLLNRALEDPEFK